MTHTCAQPLRIEPVTFFIRGPFWRGALLLANTVLSTVLASGLILSLLMGEEKTAWGFAWRVMLWIIPPLSHFVFLKVFVEGKPPHYAVDRIRWILRLRFSLEDPWPRFLPLFPRLVADAELETALRAEPAIKGWNRRYYDPRRTLTSHPLLRL